MTENAKRIGQRRGPIYLVVSNPRETLQSKPKDPIVERMRSLTSRLRDPRYYTDQSGEERLVARVLGREILDLVESNPVPLYVSLYDELRALKVADPIMQQRVVGLLTTVQAEKLKERQAEKDPDIPQQRSERTPDYGYADHLREVGKTRR